MIFVSRFYVGILFIEEKTVIVPRRIKIVGVLLLLGRNYSINLVMKNLIFGVQS